MNRLKREQKIMKAQLSDIKNYPGAVIDDPDIFYGSVTIAELKRSMELVPHYQQQIRKRRAREAAQVCKQQDSTGANYENKENIAENSTRLDNDIRHELNSTYELNSEDSTMKETTMTGRLLNSTFDKENDNENDNEIYNTVEQKDDTVLNRTFELMNGSESMNLQIDETVNQDPKSALKRSFHRYRENMQNTFVSECSQLEDETFTDAVKFDFQKDISIANRTILTGFENLQLNSRPVLGEISFLDRLPAKTKTINDTQPVENGSFQFSFCESDKENVSVGGNNECKLSGDIDKRLLKLMKTPSKMSVTAIEDLKDDLLVNTSGADFDDESKRQTPGVGIAEAQKTPTITTHAQKTPTSSKHNLNTKNMPKTPTAVQLSQKTPTSIKLSQKTPINIKQGTKTPTSVNRPGSLIVCKNAKTPNTGSKIGTWEEKKSVSTKKIVNSRIPRMTITCPNPSPVAKYVKMGIPISSMASKSRHSLCHAVEEKPSFLPRMSTSFKTPDHTKRKKIFRTPSKSPAVIGPIQNKKFFN